MRLSRKLITLVLGIALLFGPQLISCASRSPGAIVVRGPGQYTSFEVSFGYFHNSLTPYGNWVNIGNYGPCWRPANRYINWQPYFHNGYWAYTQYGWTWISHEPWGAIAFHYGTWFNDPFYGWVWVPGYVWGPAWVTWMYTDYYIGWAPLPPTFRFTGRHGYVRQPVVVNHNYYIFVSNDHIDTTNLNTVRVPVERHVEIIRNARPVTTISVVNHHVINHGPEVPAMERVRRAPISIDQVTRESRIKPMPIRIDREDEEIELIAPKLNRQEASRVIKDLDLEERKARTDRDRQIRQQPSESNEKIEKKVKPNRTDVEIEREQRQRDEQLRRREREQREDEKLHNRQEQRQREQQQPRREQEPRQLEQDRRRQQNENSRQPQLQRQQEEERLRRQQERQQRQMERDNRRRPLVEQNVQ